jgi:exodeoxyribonuclease-3
MAWQAGPVRIATWNVNSLNARMPRIEEWLAYAEPDVLCMQETKLADALFPTMAFSALGYESYHHGDGRWNGVAILSKIGLEDPVGGFPEGVAQPVEETRVVSARCGGVRVHSIYVPNGRAVGTEHYEAKLGWLGRLRQHLAASGAGDDRTVVCGDFNIAPDDRDVYDPAKFVGATHVSAAEREALAALLELGFSDAFRLVYPEQEKVFTWWDYRAGDFHSGRGMRIDLMLVSRPLAGTVRYVLVDRNARKGKLPSDHAPMLVDLDLGPAG